MEKYNETIMSLVVSDHEPKAIHEPTTTAAVVKSNRGRKPSNNNKANSQKKKQPQRGMGVEQLERLRIQEKMKRMPEIGPVDYPPSIQHNHFHQSHLALPAEPIPSVPVMYGPGNYGVPVVVGNGLLGGLEQSRVMYGGVGSDQVLMSNFVGTSKELSSMPKKMHMHQPLGLFPQQQHCDICLKKQRFHGENIGFHGVKEKYPTEVSPICYGVPRMMNRENNFDFNIGINGFVTRTARSVSYSGQRNNLQNQGAQGVVIHRNGNSMGRSVPREIEFFPGKGGRSTSSKDLEFPAEASIAVSGEAPWFTPTAYSANAPTNSIDLSLKLSL